MTPSRSRSRTKWAGEGKKLTPDQGNLLAVDTHLQHVNFAEVWDDHYVLMYAAAFIT